MNYTVQLDFSIDEEDAVRTDEEVKEVVEEIFDYSNCNASNIKVIDVNDWYWLNSRFVWERRDYLNKEDFTLLRVDRKDGHEDYWYETSKAANEYLTDKYMEQSMKAVFRVVYSKDEDIVGVERTFPFNYDVITPEDDELKSILRELSR